MLGPLRGSCPQHLGNAQAALRVPRRRVSPHRHARRRPLPGPCSRLLCFGMLSVSFSFFGAVTGSTPRRRAEMRLVGWSVDGEVELRRRSRAGLGWLGSTVFIIFLTFAHHRSFDESQVLSYHTQHQIFNPQAAATAAAVNGTLHPAASLHDALRTQQFNTPIFDGTGRHRLPPPKGLTDGARALLLAHPPFVALMRKLGYL